MAGKQGMTGRKPKTLCMMPKKYGRDWLEAMDRHSALYNAMTERLGDLVQDLGGLDALSYQQMSLCRRAIWIEYRLLGIE